MPRRQHGRTEGSGCADAILPLVSHAHAFVRMASLRALKELRRKDTLKPALMRFGMPMRRCAYRPSA